MRDDLTPHAARSRIRDVEVHTALTPAWSSDWITGEGRRKLESHGIASPFAAPAHPSGPIPLTLTPLPPDGAVPAMRLLRYRTNLGVRFHALQVVASLPSLRRAVRALQGNLR